MESMTADITTMQRSQDMLLEAAASISTTSPWSPEASPARLRGADGALPEASPPRGASTAASAVDVPVRKRKLTDIVLDRSIVSRKMKAVLANETKKFVKLA